MKQYQIKRKKGSTESAKEKMLRELKNKSLRRSVVQASNAVIKCRNQENASRILEEEVLSVWWY